MESALYKHQTQENVKENNKITKGAYFGFSSCWYDEMHDKDNLRTERVYSNAQFKGEPPGHRSQSNRQFRLLLTTHDSWEEECNVFNIAAQFPFSLYIVQEPSKGTVPPTRVGIATSINAVQIIFHTSA